MTRTIMMFPGLGAQYYQMGRELFEHDAVFRAAMNRCDTICRDLGEPAVSTVIYGRKLSESDGFDQLALSGAALLAIGSSLAATLFHRGIVADALLGYSLGETIAAVVGEVLSLEDGFRLLVGQARLVVEQAPEGAMLAVLGDPAPLLARRDLAPFYEVAGINAPRHRVLSVLARDATSFTAAIERLGLIVARLPIRYPFHASPIDPVGAGLRALIDGFVFARPRLPIFSVATCAKLAAFDASHAWRVLRGPTRFAELVGSLSREGDCRLIDAGPSGTLATFVRQIAAPGVAAYAAMDQFGQNTRSVQRLMADLNTTSSISSSTA